MSNISGYSIGLSVMEQVQGLINTVCPSVVTPLAENIYNLKAVVYNDLKVLHPIICTINSAVPLLIRQKLIDIIIQFLGHTFVYMAKYMIFRLDS